MQRFLPLLIVACFALGSCKDIGLGADGVDGGGGKGGNTGSTGGITDAGGGSTGGTGGTGACPAGQTLCTACGRSSCAAVCPIVNCVWDPDAGNGGGATGAAGAGGTSGATGAAGAGGTSGTSGTTACPCSGNDCPTLAAFNQVLATPGKNGQRWLGTVPSTVCDVANLRYDAVGCGSGVVYHANGDGEGYGYAFSLDTGVLVGAYIFNDVEFGGCSRSSYQWGDSSLFSFDMLSGMICPDKIDCSVNGDAGVCADWTCWRDAGTGAGGAGGAGGNSGAGGITAVGGSTRTGGASATGGTTTSSPPDAGLDGRVGADAAANSCENPLPLQCGDRLNHNTLIQGRPNVWSFYPYTQRVMSGPEAIYLLQPPTGCQAFVQLKNFVADLSLSVLSTCNPMSPRSAPEAGQPTFVVVDGYDGAWGTYTLEVDCTCNPDAGTSDAPPADARGGTAIAPGCDLDVAWKAIAAADLTTLGFPQTLNDTLPATLPTDANWGLKATVCQEGGYDITPLAGKPICLVEQDITQRCQGNPASVWVLMNNGAVACIYKTVRKGFGATPGVYSATSPNCTEPTLAAATSVFCGRLYCTSPWPCCPRLTSMDTGETCGLRCPVPITCDGPEDCSNGSVCCSLESAAAGFAGASCVNPSECVAPSRVICRQQADCPSPQQCAVPNPMPAYLPESYDPTLQPYSLWAVSFQVCAP